MRQRIFAVLVILGIGAGTWVDRPMHRNVLRAAGYRVLAGDFHLHSSMFSDGLLTPIGLVLEAERQGLDVIAITGHNEVIDSKTGRWFAQRAGGPTVLSGEEVVSPRHHIIAVGIEHAVGWDEPSVDIVRDVHQQGGIAIAAHPEINFHFDDATVAEMDGAEICHPMIYNEKHGAMRQLEMEHFAARGTMAAIGSSDYHGYGRMGACRTFIFATDDSPQAVISAIRAHRTVVYGLNGKAYGDPALIAAAEPLRLRETMPPNDHGTAIDWLSRAAGLIGIGGLLFARRS